MPQSDPGFWELRVEESQPYSAPELLCAFVQVTSPLEASVSPFVN